MPTPSDTMSFSVKRLPVGQKITLASAIITGVGILGAALGFFVKLSNDVSVLKSQNIQIQKEVDELRRIQYALQNDADSTKAAVEGVKKRIAKKTVSTE